MKIIELVAFSWADKYDKKMQFWISEADFANRILSQWTDPFIAYTILSSIIKTYSQEKEEKKVHEETNQWRQKA